PASLPTGTVTFLFTDIEGSTKLLDQLRADYGTVLAEQREILRASFGEWDGVEVDTQGDSFFVAFPRAADALACAAESQRLLSTHLWPRGVDVRVRMGLHTGEPVVMRTGYVGMDVHRAARIAAAGHGGQVLLSAVTRQLIGDEVPAGSELVDLGEHRLKDVRGALRLYQLTVPGLADTFPALRTLETGDEPPAPGEPPFMGLQHYDESDAHRFFGREAISTRLVDRILVEPFLAIVGASGSGKSSIARAGVVPQIREGRGEWLTQVLTPGERPLEALAMTFTSDATSLADTASLIDDLRREPRSLHLAAIRMLSGGRRRTGHLLLVVDQFEELFTLSRDDLDRDAFIACLMAAAGSGGGPVHVAITLRADFYGHLAGYGELRDAVAAKQEYIGPMSEGELRSAIEQPAADGGWEFVPGLVDLILRDVGTEPGALPLLSHALLETWQRRRGTSMTLKGYGESGGVRGAIARTADRVFNAELDADQREVARSIFLRLTELGEGTQDTRRRVNLREVLPEDAARSAAVRAVLQRLADYRLVTVAEATVEVAHEALIREWPLLREWLGEDREGLRTHRHVTEATDEWLLLDRDDGALYRGVRLAQASDWAAAHPSALNDQEEEFIRASHALALREDAEREERQRRELEAAERLAAAERDRAEEAARATHRLRRRAMFLSGALGVAAVLAVVAVVLGQQASSNEARAEANAARAEANAAEAQQNFANAESQRLAAEANTIMQLGESSELAALLAIRGIDAQYTPQADAALQRASRSQFSDRIFTAPSRVDAVAVSPDGRLLVAGAGDGNAYLWDISSGDLIGTMVVGEGLIGSVFSPDSALIALAGYENVHLWDIGAVEEIWSVPNGGVEDPAFSADGRHVAILSTEGALLLDAQTGKVVEQSDQVVGYGTVMPDRRSAILVDGPKATLVNLDDGITLQTFDGNEGGIKAFSVRADGALLATDSNDKKARIWDMATGELLQTLVGHTEILFENEFSPDGNLLLTGSLDTTARLWDVRTGAPLRRFNGHTASVYAVTFTPDGRYAVTGGRDGTVRFWDVTAPVERDTLAGPTSFMYALDFSPDGRLLFAGNADGTSQIWELETLTVRHVLVRDQRVDYGAFSPDNRYVLLSPEFMPAALWSVATGELAYTLSGSEGGVIAAAFSDDSRLMLAPVDDASLGIWEVETNRLQQTIESGFASGDLAPDGSAVFTYLDEEGRINGQIWDAETGELLIEFEQPGGILDGEFAPDGSTVAAVGRDGIARIWDVETATVVTQFKGHTNISWRTAFSPDGRYLFTTSQDKSARMWDVETGEQVRYFPGHGISAVAGVAVSPDGETVAIGSYDGFVQVTPVDGEALTDSVCDRLLRDFTDIERTIYGISDDRPTCGD
ncbi:MAG: hypothetical protein H0W17_01515, partial [Chloroflexi bacterium]|nr:hypothetical protein [Chloroflexota bacterium]